MNGIHYKSKMENIPFEEFLRRTGFSLKNFGFYGLEEVKYIVAPTNLKKILMVNAMPLDYLHGLLSKIGSLGNPENKIYANAEIGLECIDPNILVVGQRFVYRKNYTAILENFRNLFTGFALPRGISKLTPFLIIGIDAADRYVLAHYLPPIVEIHEDKLVLLDGVHRNFIARQTGANQESIVIKGVKTPFPCTSKGWNEIRVVDEKPVNIEDRYFNLKKELFRDLKGIGIDG